ncbi:MAG: vWA domain-containing protein [Flavobacteriales bacterium]
MRWIGLLVMGVWATLGSAQVMVDQANINYGDLDAYSNRWVDVTLTNLDEHSTMVLRSSFPPDYTFRFSTKTLAPDSSLTLRVKANPRKKGFFKDEVEIWFTTMNEPTVLTFVGDVKTIDFSDNPACPSFREMPPGCCQGSNTEVLTVDAVTGAPLGKSRVRLVELGRLRDTYQTDRKGQLTLEVPIAYYLVIADHEGYLPADSALYINRRTGRLTLALQPEPQPEREVLEPLAGSTQLPPSTLPTAPSEPALQDVEGELQTMPELDAPDPEPQPEPEPVPVPEPTPEPEVAVAEDGFSEAAYAPNNIVFLIDVSASMKKQGRLELLRVSMLQLSEVLRPGDKVSVVTYAVKPEIVLDPTSGEDKAAIQRVVTELEADGMTYGIRGFRAAYELARASAIPGGNNEVIVVSDGAFRVQDQEKIERLIAKSADAGIVTSIVGIRSIPGMYNKLEAMGEMGNGAFVPMTDFDQCQTVLIEEIKTRSRR